MELHREVTGAGPVVLLTHGFGASSHMFASTVAALAPAFTAIAWDMRGHGRSEVSADAADYSVAASLSDMARLLDEAGADRAVLLGHSLGGYLSLEYALAHPALVHRSRAGRHRAGLPQRPQPHRMERDDGAVRRRPRRARSGRSPGERRTAPLRAPQRRRVGRTRPGSTSRQDRRSRHRAAADDRRTGARRGRLAGRAVPGRVGVHGGEAAAGRVWWSSRAAVTRRR